MSRHSPFGLHLRFMDHDYLTSDLELSGRYARELSVALEAAIEAGRHLLAEFHRPEGARGKRGKCPADNEAEALIRDRLDSHFPAYGQRGEELQGRDRAATDDEQHLWQIDPNDGTSAFQRGARGAAVSIGLIRQGRPVLGVVFAYGARAGRGDWIAWAEGESLWRNGRTVDNKHATNDWPAGTLFVSQHADSRSVANAEYCAPGRFRAMPSIAYRLALTAVGEGVAGVSLSRPCAWDIAGGHALLVGARRALCTSDGRPVVYDEQGECGAGHCWGGLAPVIDELSRRDARSVLGPAPANPTPYPLIVADPRRIVSHVELLDRAQACLVGQLAGDNLGALVEFQSPDEVRRRFPQGPRELLDGGVWNLLAGQPTDDSELALLLARSIIQSGEYDVEAAGRAYVWWLASSPFDVGNTTRATLGPGLELLRQRAPVASTLEQAAARLTSQANGALMRVAPLAIYGHALRETQLAELARRDARLTHAQPVCQDANAVYCIAIAYALRTGADPLAVFEHAVGWARAAKVEADVLAALERSATELPPFSHSGTGWVLRALQIAFYQLRHAPTLSEALAQTILLGGDTDTNAAVTGALYGAAAGLRQVPGQWLDRLLTCRPLPNMPNVRRPRPVGFWPVDCLEIAEILVWLGREKADAGR